MTEKIISSVYTKALVPLIIFTMKVLGKFNPKIADGLEMRKTKNGTAPWLALAKGTRPIWIHCASGEFEYAKPVIKRLKKKTAVPILVTYFSPTVKKAVENFSGVDMSCPLPWDRPEEWEKFFAHHSPQMLLIARTDTWPEMLRQARLHQVPSLLFSATLVTTSGRAKPLARLFSKFVFNNLDAIYCVTAEDQKIFAQLGSGEKATVVGDTRYDQVIERLQNPKPISQYVTSSETPTLVAGSTWPEDEIVLIEALAHLKGSLRSIIVPHEPHLDHIRDLEKMAQASGLSISRYSKLSVTWDSDVLVIDQMGILAELYLLGTFAFVGGSYKKTVHSVMEPLAAGCPTLVGPLHTNNREAVSFQSLLTPSGLPSVLVAYDAEDFARKLKLLSELAPRTLMDNKAFIQNEILNRSQKSDEVVAWALNHLS